MSWVNRFLNRAGTSPQGVVLALLWTGVVCAGTAMDFEHTTTEENVMEFTNAKTVFERV